MTRDRFRSFNATEVTRRFDILDSERQRRIDVPVSECQPQRGESHAVHSMCRPVGAYRSIESAFPAVRTAGYWLSPRWGFPRVNGGQSRAASSTDTIICPFITIQCPGKLQMNG